MATVMMFRDRTSGELIIQASGHPDWMAESLWVAVGAIQRGQAVIVLDADVQAVAEEVALAEAARHLEAQP